MNGENSAIWHDYLEPCHDADARIDFHPESYPHSRPSDVRIAVLDILKSAPGLSNPRTSRAGVKKVKFICGKGTGTLRSTIESILKGNDLVHSWRMADGGGSFIVSLAWPLSGQKALKNLSRLNDPGIRKAVSHKQLASSVTMLRRVLADYGIRHPGYKLVLNLCKTALDNPGLIDSVVINHIRKLMPRLVWTEFRLMNKPVEIRQKYLCMFVRTMAMDSGWENSCKKSADPVAFRRFTAKLEKHLKNGGLI